MIGLWTGLLIFAVALPILGLAWYVWQDQAADREETANWESTITRPSSRRDETAVPATTVQEEVVVSGVEEKTEVEEKTRAGPKKRALLFGLNYRGTDAELQGCINDVNEVKAKLLTQFGFTDVMVLTDDTATKPTKANMQKAIQTYLLANVASGDSLYLHYSGHGGWVYDRNSEESDGKDETIIPLDYLKNGQLTDDTLYSWIVPVMNKVPGAKLTVVFDSCHSGTCLDLPWQYTCTRNNTTGAYSVTSNKPTKSQLSNVVFLSGCLDSQTSADVQNSGQPPYGALSNTFLSVLTEASYNVTYRNLLTNIHAKLIAGRFTQRPQLGASKSLNLDSPFSLSP